MPRLMPRRQPPPPATGQRRPMAEALEPKRLYSADLGLASFGSGLPDPDVLASALAPAPHLSPWASSPTAAATSALTASHQPLSDSAPTHELVFIDARVPDADLLVQDILQQAAQGRHIDVIRIHADDNGLATLTQALQTRQGLGAVHLIGHGQAGQMQLGHSTLDTAALLQHAPDIAQWGAALAPDGDLMLYGCDVGATPTGLALVQGLAALTGADVAASDDPTGQALRGGDWALEIHSGLVNSQLAISQAAQAQWQHTLASSVPSTAGTALWADAGTGGAQLQPWDGVSAGSQSGLALANGLTVMQSAQSSTRNESFIMGVDSGGQLHAYLQRDGSWYNLDGLLNLPGSQPTNRQPFAVAYEQQSGDALLIWSGSGGIAYRVWNGSSFLPEGNFNYSGGNAPQHMDIAARPGSDELALGVSTGNGHNLAMVWDGGAWGRDVVLDTSGGSSAAAEGLDIAVAYEHSTGTLMVAYGIQDDGNVYTQLLDAGSNTWVAGPTLNTGMGGETYYITLSSSSQGQGIVLGQMSYAITLVGLVPVPIDLSGFAIWTGNAWTGQQQVSTHEAITGIPVSAAFETLSNDVLAVYQDGNGQILYQTWSSTAGWSGALNGPTLSDTPTALTLYRDPHSNHMMLASLSADKSLAFTDWDGQAWGSMDTVTNNAGVSSGLPYTWLWRHEGSHADGLGLWLGGSLASEAGWSGVNTARGSEILRLNEAGLSLGAGSTSGTFSHVVDLSAFGLSTLGDVAHVSRSTTLWQGMTAQRGDILFAVGSAGTLHSSNSLTVATNDIVLFRPDAAGDLSAGQFILLGNLAGGPIQALALAEKDTWVGDTIVQAGSLLFSQGAGNAATDLYQLAAGGLSTLLRGADLGIQVGIASLELVSAPTTWRNSTLPQGSLLLSLRQSGSIAGLGLGANDVALLNLSRSALAHTTAGSATLLIEGSALGIGTGNAIDTLALQRPATDNSAPVITSQGSAASASHDVAEGQTVALTLSVFDPDQASSTLAYTLSGPDAARFTFDPGTGELRFITPPDFEAPDDANADHTYQVTVQASDGSRTDTQALSITVTPVNEHAPVITSHNGDDSAALTLAENTAAGSLVTTITSTDADWPEAPRSYTLSGPDAARFTLNATTGALTLNASPDFEAPDDANADHTYQVTVQASDGSRTDTQALSITITPVNEHAPVITSHNGDDSATLTLAENTAAGSLVTTITSTDADWPDAPRSYTLSGPDAARFTLNATTGALTLNAAPDFEAPDDANADRQYQLTVTATDEGGLSHSQTLLVNLRNQNEAPVLTGQSMSLVQAGRARLVLQVSDVDSTAAELRIHIDAVSHGHFIDTRDDTITQDFSLQEANDGTVVFAHDGSAQAPLISLRLSDGDNTLSLPGTPVQFTLIPPPPPDTDPGDGNTDEDNTEPDNTEPSGVAAGTAPDATQSATTVPDMLLALRLQPVAPPESDLSAPALPPADPNQAINLVALQTKADAGNASPELDTLAFTWGQSPPNWESLSDGLRQQLDDLQQQLQSLDDTQRGLLVSSVAVSTGLSVGYVIWLLRGGALLGSMLSAMPAWQMIDPLPVLTRGRGGAHLDGDDAPDAGVEQLFGSDEQGDDHHRSPAPSTPPHADPLDAPAGLNTPPEARP